MNLRDLGLFTLVIPNYHERHIGKVRSSRSAWAKILRPNLNNKLYMMVFACNSSYLGGKERLILLSGVALGER
jgi:hypothetical protein